jgi:hypothetical protein
MLKGSAIHFPTLWTFCFVVSSKLLGPADHYVLKVWTMNLPCHYKLLNLKIIAHKKKSRLALDGHGIARSLNSSTLPGPRSSAQSRTNEPQPNSSHGRIPVHNETWPHNQGAPAEIPYIDRPDPVDLHFVLMNWYHIHLEWWLYLRSNWQFGSDLLRLPYDTLALFWGWCEGRCW